MIEFTRARKKLNLIIDLVNALPSLVFEINRRDKSGDLIIYLNTQKQLYEKGEDADGKELIPAYSPYTIEIKQVKKQPLDRVTLKDTGQFYSSFEVVVRKSEIVIIADTIKEDTDLAFEYGKRIIGLSDDSKSTYRTYLLQGLIQLLLKELIALRGFN